MLRPQEHLIKNIKSRINKRLSFIDLISSILNINYDAAYRRVNNKTALSLDEAVTLAKYFNISLNTLYSVGEKNSILVSKAPDINNASDLEQYFENAYKNLSDLLNKENASICYSANDIPIFYLLANTKLSKFKIYAWLNLLDIEFSASKIEFSNFNPNANLLEFAQDLGKLYRQFNITEIWNDNVLDKTIKQVYHYYEIGLLHLNDALSFCDELENIVKDSELNARLGDRKSLKENPDFALYHNEIMALGNTIIFKTDNYKVVNSPYALLSYFRVTHPESCADFEKYFKKQLESSNSLSSSDEKGRSLFFNKLYKKIEHLRTRLKIDDLFPIL